MDEVTLEEWERERDRLRDKLVTENTKEWQDSPTLEGLRLVGGVDLSFVKSDSSNSACAAYVVCSFPSMEVVYEDMKMVELTTPYVAGFLAMRESGPLLELLSAQRSTRPEVTPDAVLVDGNGVLHGAGFGLACHVGVEGGAVAVGVAKNLYQMSDQGLLRDEGHQEKISSLSSPGDSFDLLLSGGARAGAAVRTCAAARKPVFVSVGHAIGLDAAVRLVAACSRHRVPEPTRQADIRSREFIRKMQL